MGKNPGSHLLYSHFLQGVFLCCVKAGKAEDDELSASVLCGSLFVFFFFFVVIASCSSFSSFLFLFIFLLASSLLRAFPFTIATNQPTTPQTDEIRLTASRIVFSLHISQNGTSRPVAFPPEDWHGQGRPLLRDLLEPEGSDPQVRAERVPSVLS